MPDILHEVMLGATPKDTYRALTDQQGLASWWTTQILARPNVGATIQANFLNGQHVLEVLNLKDTHEVEWITRESFFEDWVGKHITWTLSRTDQGTTLLFGQHGFPSTGGSFSKVSYGWGVYLRSLKHYLEHGQGNPHSF